MSIFVPDGIRPSEAINCQLLGLRQNSSRRILPMRCWREEKGLFCVVIYYVLFANYCPNYPLIRDRHVTFFVRQLTPSRFPWCSARVSFQNTTARAIPIFLFGIHVRRTEKSFSVYLSDLILLLYVSFLRGATTVV